MTKTNCVLSLAAASALVAAPALAGDDYGTSVSGATASATSGGSNSGDWCDTLKGIGKIYKDKENPFIQEFKIFGRFHYQYAYVDGEDVNGDDFSEDFSTVRRFRGGFQTKFLNYLKFKARADFISDGKHSGGERDWGYQGFDEISLSFDAAKAFDLGLDKAAIEVGKVKLPIGFDQHQSSKKIKTVERSALTNKVRPDNSTGIRLLAAQGSWSGYLGYYSNEDADELSWYGADEGEFFIASSTFDLGDDSIILDFLYNNGETDGSSRSSSLNWVASASYTMKRDRFEFGASVIYGDNGDQSRASRSGDFYGIILQPSYWLLEDKLEVVGRYQYQGSDESEGIRTNSRYFRADHGGDVNSGRGDSHHSIYTGLNWYHCGHNSKIQTGVEYETLDTPDGDADAFTLWAAYRFYF